MQMIFFYFLKIIFNISTSKQSKKYKPHSILVKKNQNLTKHSCKRNAKQTLKVLRSVLEIILNTSKQSFINFIFNNNPLK